jgi:hypothetical protein
MKREREMFVASNYTHTDYKKSSLSEINKTIKELKKLSSDNYLPKFYFDFLLRQTIINFLEKEINNKFENTYCKTIDKIFSCERY